MRGLILSSGLLAAALVATPQIAAFRKGVLSPEPDRRVELFL